MGRFVTTECCNADIRVSKGRDFYGGRQATTYCDDCGVYVGQLGTWVDLQIEKDKSVEAALLAEINTLVPKLK